MKGNKEKIALAVLALGIALIATSLIMSAMNYPWQLLIGYRAQDEKSVPDPPPIILDDDDAGILVSDDLSMFNPDLGDETEEIDGTLLPGNEEDTAKAQKPPSYIVLGTFKIPSLKISQNLLEGTDRQLKYGVGHLTGSAMPGQKGNVVVAGHRSYPFRHLDKLKEGDKIIVNFNGENHNYTVFDKFDVLPEETWVLKAVTGEEEVLTIITCTPYIVSSHRLIIRARASD